MAKNGPSWITYLSHSNLPYAPGPFRSFRYPVKELRHAIDLVVVFAVRKLRDLAAEFVEPGRVLGEVDTALFDDRGLGVQAGDLVLFWDERDGARCGGVVLAPELLKERGTEALVLDDSVVRARSLRVLDDFAFELRKQ